LTIDKKPRKKKASTAAAKPPKAAHATATFRKPYVTDADKITACTEQTAAMTAGPGWANATDLQKACAAWTATTTSIQTTGTTIEGFRAQMALAVVGMNTLRATWIANRKAVISALSLFCNGSAATINAFGADVFTHTVGGAILVPGGLSTMPGTSAGTVDFMFDDSVNRYGFVVQFASNTSDPTTFSPQIPCHEGFFSLDGQTSGATLHFRAAAVDPTQKLHVTDWSPWIAGTVH
jgi:hypothetical protein